MIALDTHEDLEHTGLATGPAATTESSPVDTLIIGLGNPILGDDGVGWQVAEEVRARVPGNERVEVDCLAVGGLRLMERMLGYRHVILIDAIQSGENPEGTVSTFRLDELRRPGMGHTASAHDASLITALQTAHAMGGAIPHRVDIVAIEARACHDFSEQLSPRIAAATAMATLRVFELLQR